MMRICSSTSRPTIAADAAHADAADAIKPNRELAAPAAVTVAAEELKKFEAWRALQRDVIDANEAAHPSLDKILATGLVAAAATPAVLLLPTWAPLVFVESAFAYFDGAVDDLPFWTLRASIALAAHPAITLTCATSCALAFASQRSVLNSVGWVENSDALVDEATRVGRTVGFASALISPVAVLGAHHFLTIGWLDGLMPRALALDYWGAAGGFASFSYLFVLYGASLPITTWCAGTIGPSCASMLYANDGGASFRLLLKYAGGALALVTILSFFMHRQWEFQFLQKMPVPGAGERVAGVVVAADTVVVDADPRSHSTTSTNIRSGDRVYSASDDPTDEEGGERELWVNERHRAWEYDAAALGRLPGLGPEAARRIDELVQAGLRAGRQSAACAAQLRRTRVAQECEFGPWKHVSKGKTLVVPRGEPQPPPDVQRRSLGQLRADERAAYDRHKTQLRRDLKRYMELASDRERARQLADAMTTLERLREPAAGLSRKQLKVVNGALVAVAEARRGSQVLPLQDEMVMMRRVAQRHAHGVKLCEEAREVQ